MSENQAARPASTRLLRFTSDAATCARALARLEAAVDADDAAISITELPDGRHVVEVYFGTSLEEAALQAALAGLAAEMPSASLTVEDVAARDWVAASLAGLPPVRAGRFMVHGAHDRGRVPPNAIGIEIEAALAFGTGHHGTTRGCLLALEALIKEGYGRPRKGRAGPAGSRRRFVRVLDVGTGTGVLAIAAAKALDARVLASDIDPVAVRIARANARANAAAGRIAFLHAAGVGPARFRAQGPYRLIFANILIGPLKTMARPLAALLAPGGSLVLSGLLHTQAAAALAAYRAQGLRLRRKLRLDEWTTLVLSRG